MFVWSTQCLSRQADDSPGHLDHHVEGVVAGGQGDVVEGGDGALTVLDEHLVGVSVGLPSLLRGVV